MKFAHATSHNDKSRNKIIATNWLDSLLIQFPYIRSEEASGMMTDTHEIVIFITQFSARLHGKYFTYIHVLYVQS